MANIHHTISFGIGSPASIPQFLTFGLGPFAAAASEDTLALAWHAAPLRQMLAPYEVSGVANFTGAAPTFKALGSVEWPASAENMLALLMLSDGLPGDGEVQ